MVAHDNWEVLETLLRLLDDQRNHIYLHIDSESNPPREITEFVTSLAELTLIPRRPVQWADYSQVAVTLDLLRAASDHDHFDYYHLLSGTDLPLKIGDDFHGHFTSTAVEYIGVVAHESWYSVRRLKFYHLFTSLRRYRTSKALKALDRLLEYAQRLIRVNRLRRHRDWTIYDGWSWFSITDELARFVTAQADEISRTFKWSIAPDELFMQTLVMNSNYRDRLHDISDLSRGSLRLIDWTRGSPYAFTRSDFQELQDSSALFARKFQGGAEFEIVRMWERHLLGGQATSGID